MTTPAGPNGHGPNREEETEEEVEVISLVDDEGLETDYYLHEVVEVEGNPYYVLEAVESEEEVVILKLEDETLVSPEPAELEKVIEVLEAEWESEDDQEDEEDEDEES